MVIICPPMRVLILHSFIVQHNSPKQKLSLWLYNTCPAISDTMRSFALLALLAISGMVAAFPVSISTPEVYTC